MTFDFTNQVVLITGASGNLGKAVASAFHAANARMVLVDHATRGLDKIFPDLTNSSDVYYMAPFDITQTESAQSVVRNAVARFGRIDILVNTTGGHKAGAPLHETDLRTLDYLMNLNARSAFVISQAVVPVMLANGSGKIILVSGRAGISGSANSSAYSAAKAAVLRFTESMAAELKDKNININCVLPGTIDTPQNRLADPAADTSRWVAADAIADAILFLASPEARAVNGAAIPVYGKG
jgi:NAD(P)-dependent dehydrogenase (short-subunit alcohol dehydrogenase family)